jgi:hypothetical protein
MTRLTIVSAILVMIFISIGSALTLEALVPPAPALPGNPSCSAEDLLLLNRFAAARKRYATAYRESEAIALASGRSAAADPMLAHSREAEKAILERGATELDEQLRGLEVQDSIMDRAENDGDSIFATVSPRCQEAIEAKVLQILTTTPESATR